MPIDAYQIFVTGQLKDRLRRLEHYGDLSVHPSEAPRRNDRLRYVIFDLGGMEFIDARYAIKKEDSLIYI